ncbi:alginate lyase family protein [Endozoicomonas arenosclerae]|uniref:alginate lyase family protein n=1 Tax=Endozoicomonas arenosclerae TaxID=1633495 RepID=UPI00078104BD|nr:alginate lyase family protein [Endozoicomonas arenosclerae]
MNELQFSRTVSIVLLKISLLALIPLNVSASNLLGSDRYESLYSRSLKTDKSYKAVSQDYCSEVVTPFSGPLSMPSKYEGSGSGRDQLNAEAEARYKKQTEDIKKYEQYMAKITDKYVLSARRDSVLQQCALSWLNKWAEAKSMTQDATTSTGRAVRQWFLSSIAASYLKLNRPLSEDEAIRNWLAAVALKVMEDYQGYFVRPEKINNHMYWAGAGIMLTGIVASRKDFFDWGVRAFNAGADQVDDNGFLKNEMKRKTRALVYHNFALIPLVIMAEEGKLNGIDLYGRNNQAIKRLGAAVMTGIENVSVFAEASGSAQDTTGLEKSYSLVWMELYQQHYPLTTRGKQLLTELRSMRHTYIGGNLTNLILLTE